MSNMRKEEVIDLFFRQLFLNKKSHPSGQSCTYVQLNKDIGIKCYVSDGGNRNRAFAKQKELSKQGLAPKAYFKFHFYDADLVCRERRKISCYVTQHGKLCKKNEFKQHLGELSFHLSALGYKDLGDVRQKNCRMIDDRLVLIDCDRHTI